MKLKHALAPTLLAATLALSACGGDTTTSGGQGTGTSAADSAQDEQFNDADVTFAQMMIPHHEQAVEMSDVLLAKEGIDPAVVELAESIKSAQQPEIETMTSWLEAWDEPLSGHGMDGHDMGGDGGGMMSEEDMQNLQDAEGDDAARLFLTQMTAHHEGAIKMAEKEIDEGSNAETIELARTIVETQQGEIDEMEQLLRTL
jgi:uncharacterized protein (DUF305 family)